MAGPKDATHSHISEGDVFRVLLAAVAYFLAHQIAFLFPDAEKVIMAIWPAGGIGLAALLLSPYRLWPALVACFYVAGVSADVLLAHRSFLAGVGYMTGNMVESLGCAAVIIFTCGRPVRFDRIRDVLALVVGSVLVNAVSTCIGAGTAAAAKDVSFANAYLSWYVSDGLGVLLLTPLIVTWSDLRAIAHDLSWKHAAESVAFMAVWCVLAWSAFRFGASMEAFYLHPYMLVAVLAWPALRLGQRGVTAAVSVLAVIAITSKAVSEGPLLWGGEDLTARLLETQIFLAFTGTTGFLLAASRAEAVAAERAVRDNRELLNSVVEGTSDAVYVKDAQGRYLLVNTEAARIAGRQPSEILGRDDTSFFPPDEARIIIEGDRAVMAGDKPRTYEEFLTAADGTPHVFLSTKGPLFDAKGKRAGLFGVARDITELSLAQRLLRDSEEKFARSFRMTPLSTALSLASNGKYVEVNEAFLSLVGCSRNEVIGHDSLELGLWVHPEERAEFRERIIESGEVRNVPATLRTKSGETRDVLYSGATVSIAGTQHVISQMFDITERKRAEEQVARYRDHLEELVRERTRELEESRQRLARSERLASLGTFAAGIAHEINNPLGMVLLGTEMALASLDRKEQLAAVLAENKLGLERCARIIRNVLDFARQAHAERQPVNLNDIIRSGMDFTREYARKYGVTVAAHLDDSVATIPGNSTELEQVIVNLISNAVQACTDGGRVVIETTHADGKMRMTVRDTGCGMSTGQIEHAFDPFFTTRHGKGGTGLGLSIVHGIVTSHGGTVGITSEEGKGTTLTVEFPQTSTTSPP